MTLGGGAMTNTIPEISQYSDVVFIIGSNTGECHPLIAKHVIQAQSRGAKLIVADPRMTDMANKADIWLRLPVGHNITLLNGLMHVIIKEKLYKAEFIQEHADGFDDLTRAVEDYTPAYVEDLTGISQQDLIAAARLYAGAGAAVILYCMGVTQFTYGTGTVASVSNLAVITGNLGRPGTGVCPLRGQNNVQGACDMGGLPNVFPGYLSVTDEKHRARFEKAWNTQLPPKPGLRIPEVADAVHQGKVKALYVFGENPVMSDPDNNHFIHALQELELLVVQDIFLTETARLAHVVLPAAGWAEKEGTFSNTERRVQRVRKAIEPPGNAKTDWWIFCALAQKMGAKGFEYQNTQEIWDELRQVVPEKWGGMTYARLDQVRGLNWPCPNEEHAGTPILYVGGKFTTPTGKANLKAVLFHPTGVAEDKIKEFKNPIVGKIAELPDREYAFTLTTGRRGYHYHTGTMTRKSLPLNQVGPEQMVEVNPQDAAVLEIEDGDYVKLTTRRGNIAVKVWVTDRVPEKTVFTTFHFWEANVNELTVKDTDPLSVIPEYKVAAVKIEKISLAEAKALYLEKAQKYRVELEQEVVAEMQKGWRV
ncbi:formate dehydrogenase major subunit [Thermoflexales bacterium]|nr:formate dehydrogenase major subunit [Thermoflexales bacterium]